MSVSTQDDQILIHDPDPKTFEEFLSFFTVANLMNDRKKTKLNFELNLNFKLFECCL